MAATLAAVPKGAQEERVGRKVFIDVKRWTNSRPFSELELMEIGFWDITYYPRLQYYTATGTPAAENRLRARYNNDVFHAATMRDLLESLEKDIKQLKKFVEA